MNTDQINSLIRSILKIVGAALAAHGLTADAAIVNGEDCIGVVLALAGVIMSINWHKTPGAGSAGSNPGAVLLLALILPMLLFNGCATAYKAEKSADISVTAAIQVWSDYVTQYHPPLSQELAVKAAFEKYQAAELTAIDASIALINASTTNSISNAASSVDWSAAASAGNDLITLMRSFGVKL